MSITPQTTGTIQRPDLGFALAEWDNEMQARKYIGSQVLPFQDVLESSGNYGKWTLEQLSKSVENISREAGSGYAKALLKVTQDNYETFEYGLEVDIDERFQQKFKYIWGGNPLALDMIATQFARRIVMEKAEQRIAAAVDMGSAAIATFTEQAISTDWTQVSSATPSEDIRAGMEIVLAACGEKPTHLVLSGKAFRYLKQNESLLKELRGASLLASDKKSVSAAMIADFLDLEEVVIADGMYNSAASEASTPAYSYIWNTDRALLYVKSKPMAAGDPMGAPGIGRVLHWAADGSVVGGRIEQYQKPGVRGHTIRVRHDVDEKIEVPEMGLIFSGVLS